MNKRPLYNKNELGRSFGFAVAAMLVGQFALGLFFSPFVREDGSLPDVAFWLMQALYTLIIGFSAFLYATVARTDFFNATAVNRAPKFAHVGWGCLITVFLIALMLPLNELFLKLIVLSGLPEPSVDLPMQIAPLIVVSCVLAAMTEEVLFRGTVARTLADNKNKLAALAISGALFALFHTNPAQTLHQFVLGALLTLLVLRSGSVWTTVLVHFFNNLLAVILTFLLEDDAVFVNYWYVFVPVGLVGFVASLFGYLKTTSDAWEPTEGAEVAMDGYSKSFLGVGIAVCAVLWVANLLGWL